MTSMGVIDDSRWADAPRPGPRRVPFPRSASEAELDAAGIREPRLRDSYRRCRDLNAEHGKTYFLATRLLPAARRPYVHALYGFARYADEIVDDLSAPLGVDERARRLDALAGMFLHDLEAGHSAHPIGRALVDTANRWQIPIEHFAAFLESMRMDLTVTEYETYDDLDKYVYGSAAVIGLQMLPILMASTQHQDEAAASAMNLGRAFQLANFVRDVGEDLDRGRLYLPLEDLARYGLSRADVERRVTTPPVRALLEHQIRRVRSLSELASPGIDQLHPTSQPCIRAAQELYVGIVDEVEAIDFEIFDRRATTSTWRRARVALPAYGRALAARTGGATG